MTMNSPVNPFQTSVCRGMPWLAMVLLIVAAVSSAQAGLDGVSLRDKEADVDWPMYDQPFLPEIDSVKIFDDRLKAIWFAALKQPDVETRRRAAMEIGLSASRGMPGLVEFIPKLLEQMNAADAHPAMMLAAAKSLIQLDAKQAAPSFLIHNQRGATSGVIRGGTIESDDAKQPPNGGIEFVLLTDPVLAMWNHEPCKPIWLARLKDQDTAAPVRASAIEALATIKLASAIEPLTTLALDTKATPASHRLLAARAVATMKQADLETQASALITLSLTDRIVAALLLSRHEGDPAVKLMLKLAADTEPAVATIAVERLFQIDPTLLAPLVPTLVQNADATIRLQAARTLATAKTAASIDAMAPLLDDLSPQVRGFVRDRFIEYDKDATLSATIRQHASTALAGNSWRAIEQAAIILGRIDHETSVPRLVALLPHQRGEVRMAAIIALRRIGLSDPAVLATIESHTQKAADQWLADAKVARENTHLPQVMNYDRDRELSQMLQLLGMAKYQPAGNLMERFIPKMSGFWTEARGGAIWALGMLHEDQPDDRLAKLFVSRLSDLDPNNPELLTVRRMSAISIGRMKATAGLKGLEVFYDIERTSRHIGGACRWGLIRITGKELPPLDPRQISDTGWFIQPINPAPRK